MNPKLARILIQKAMNVTVYIRVDQWPKPLPFSMVFESVEESLQVLSVPCGPHRETFQQIQEHPKAILKGIVSDHWFEHCTCLNLPNTAVSSPSGKGDFIRLPFTACLLEIFITESRPITLKHIYYGGLFK